MNLVAPLRLRVIFAKWPKEKHYKKENCSKKKHMMIESKIKIYYMSTQTQNDLIHKINGTSNQYTTTLPHFLPLYRKHIKKTLLYSMYTKK